MQTIIAVGTRAVNDGEGQQKQAPTVPITLLPSSPSTITTTQWDPTTMTCRHALQNIIYAIHYDTDGVITLVTTTVNTVDVTFDRHNANVELRRSFFITLAITTTTTTSTSGTNNDNAT
mmetsp:Transcript_64855/g.76775  ORF Transcript_64855/g.76775 Transcript_64855/m.76775 type:complete len:119 (-) Transcript_64855:113-469(-)